MDTSIQNIWNCWYLFRKNKKKTKEFREFEYNLESNLLKLYHDINNETYSHGGYIRFTVFENKKRDVVVACIRDRVVHRMVYEYLINIFDKTFIYDVWSCRKDKGLLSAIERAEYFAKKYSNNFVWRSDIKKFFDSVNHDVLMQCIERRIFDDTSIKIIKNIISSYKVKTLYIEKDKNQYVYNIGIPIGNLTSQICSNIYLNEFDRYVVHILKPKTYMRYGDDFLLFEIDKDNLIQMRVKAIRFLKEKLFLTLNSKNDIIIKPKHGIHFLGVNIFPKGRRLKNSVWKKVVKNLQYKNFASYLGLVRKHSNDKKVKEVNWRISCIFDEDVSI